MPKITFKTAAGEKIVESTGEDLFQLAESNGVSTGGSCAGMGVCGLCRCRISEGSENASAVTEAEKQHLGSVNIMHNERLSCQVMPTGDMTVEFE